MTESHPGSAVRLTVTGEIDMATVGALETALRDAFAVPDATGVVADFAGVTFCDSSGVAALDRAYAEGVARGITFCLTGVSGTVRRVLEITGMLDALTDPGS
ncbi:STAS domain-containing protein [Actinoplanes sp. NPDC049548]|uniref:STAS domain-containing protein n=1 Tax=Actinoplanes sp. NPDC049548 TaxID=3155152 RepID=UPI00342C014D